MTAPDFITHRQSEPHHVYELFAEDWSCLYVGCTRNLIQRLGAHSVKPWWPKVAQIVTNRYPDEAAGIAAETDRIRVLNPKHNFTFTDHPAHIHGWEMRKAKAQLRHEQGDMCQPGTQCKRCNAIYRANGIPVVGWYPTTEELRRRLVAESKQVLV